MWFEFLCQSSNPNQFEQSGTVRLHRDGPNSKKPAWFVLLKAIVTLGMIAIGFALVMPFIPLPWWKSALITSGVLIFYVGVAYFVRPEPNTDNMGWIGGAADNPFQFRVDSHLTLLCSFLHEDMGEVSTASGAGLHPAERLVRESLAIDRKQMARRPGSRAAKARPPFGVAGNAGFGLGVQDGPVHADSGGASRRRTLP